MTYRLSQPGSIVRLSDNAQIPVDPGNSDYREYLDWLAGGSIPEPADPAPPPPADWHGFLTALRDTPVFQSLRGAARVDVAANALATELRLALGEAALGMVDVEGVQSLLSELWPALSSADREAIVALVLKHRIPLQAPS